MSIKDFLGISNRKDIKLMKLLEESNCFTNTANNAYSFLEDLIKMRNESVRKKKQKEDKKRQQKHKGKEKKNNRK